MGYIYLITNKINGKQYIGQSIQNDINKRWNQYKNLKKHNIGRCLYNSFIKYGIHNFKFQIICICFDEDCNKYEIEYIKKFNTIVPKGYNLSEGGGNKSSHPDTKKLISEKLKGKKLSEKAKEKISKANKGRVVTIETKEKISKTLKLREQSEEFLIKRLNMIKNYSKETKEKIKHGLLIGIEANKKRVAQYDLKGKLIKIYDCMSEASRQTSICQRTISKVCNNVKYCKSAGGFIWKFI